MTDDTHLTADQDSASEPIEPEPTSQEVSASGESEAVSETEHSEAESDEDASIPDDEPRDNDRLERSQEPPDERAARALKFVSDVVRDMQLDCRARLRRPRGEHSEGEIHIEIAGADAGRIIGKKGQVLQALQFLTHRIINRSGLERRHVLVDAEGYLSRRDNSLASMARRLGRQAVDEGKIITFEPMNPRDRRVVHLALAKFQGVVTKSDGEGDERRVQIIPVRR
ncbi:MAG TPA: R3H domain-containing nucleic acid-binding protein [Polyangiaceae bacterium]|jgi:spoIIIJ-associated protein